MATLKQIAANRANSQRSTGPNTPGGKANSCLNRLSHGFVAASHVIPGESQEQFLRLLRDLMEEYRPANPTEQILVEKMVHNQWLSLRAFRLQSDAFRSCTDFIPPELGLLIRYLTAAQRAFHKAHTELLKVQKERQKSEIGFESQNSEQAAGSPRKSPVPPEKSGNETVIEPGFSPHDPEMDKVMTAGGLIFQPAA